MSLVDKIYTFTEHFPNTEKYGIISQIQRAGVSVPSNIAEGSAKTSNKDFARFLEIALGSLFETETLLILSYRRKYLDEKIFNETQNEITELEKMMSKFLNNLK